jgi:anti-sigma regulatory factor (Ser/Thr protein kinase)
MPNHDQEHIMVEIPNRLECIKWLYPICAGVLGELPFSEKERHMIIVAISEGFTNAYQHGNQKRDDARIRLLFYPGDKSLKILIEDDAVLPINPNINQISGPINRQRISGRGLPLMREIADEAFYEYDSKGVNILTLIFNFENRNKRVNSF